MSTLDSRTAETFVSGVRLLAERQAVGALSQSISAIDPKTVMPGKMLRTRLAGRLFAAGFSSEKRTTLQAACAATELVHTASLCHDDVVDNSLIRRSLPTLWKSTGPSGAILIGDLLLCAAMDLLMITEDGRYLRAFMAKVRQVVEAEAEQELLWRGRQVDVASCLRLARGKTGPLFAFCAGIYGGASETLRGLLEEAGYRIGTAYQLADDLLDILGTESAAGKTLRTDSARRKLTLPQVGGAGQRITREHISELCISAVQLLDDYPKAQEGLMHFLGCDLQPVLARHLGIDMGIAV